MIRPRSGTSRIAETIPSLTEPSSRRGFPITKICSPSSGKLVVIVSGFERSAGKSTFKSARSASSSTANAPATGYVRPLPSSVWISTRCAPLMTCIFVKTSPGRTKNPVPLMSGSPFASYVRTDTTEGFTRRTRSGRSVRAAVAAARPSGRASVDVCAGAI